MSEWSGLSARRTTHDDLIMILGVVAVCSGQFFRSNCLTGWRFGNWCIDGAASWWRIELCVSLGLCIGYVLEQLRIFLVHSQCKYSSQQ